MRHILISVSDTSDETAMEEARAKADEILAEFNAGDKTAESFGELAKENTGDSNGDEGGLYENIMPGQMVTEFNDWCFDPARQPGDTGIVKTSYGYHIMYFSSTGEHAYWYVRAEEDYLNELSVSVLQEVAAKFEVTESEQNAAIVDIMQQN